MADPEGGRSRRARHPPPPPLRSRPRPLHCGPGRAPSIAVSAPAPYCGPGAHGLFSSRSSCSGAPTHSLVTSTFIYYTKHAHRNRIYSAFQGSYSYTARVILKYCRFTQRSSVDLVSINYCKVLNSINIMIPHGYVTASATANTREPGREADQVLGCCRFWAATGPVGRMSQTTSGFV